MTAIKRATLEAVALAARNTFPDEFIALLSSKEQGRVIDEYVLLPSVFGKVFSSIRLDLLPYNAGAIGSVHSHPGSSAMPSRADLAAFKRMGEIHLIIARPFNLGNVRAYNKLGSPVELEVVD